MATKKQIIKNLNVLLEAVEAQKELNLDSYCTEEHGCGTLFCNAGLATTLPHFKRRGWKFDRYGDVAVKGESVWSGGDKDFGPDAFERLFEKFGEGEYDHMYPRRKHGEPDCSHKKLAVWRLKLAIAMLEVPA
jgi:hypothetical protein